MNIQRISSISNRYSNSQRSNRVENNELLYKELHELSLRRRSELAKKNLQFFINNEPAATFIKSKPDS